MKSFTSAVQRSRDKQLVYLGDGVLGGVEVDIVVKTLSEHLIVFPAKEKRYFVWSGNEYRTKHRYRCFAKDV